MPEVPGGQRASIERPELCFAWNTQDGCPNGVKCIRRHAIGNRAGACVFCGAMSHESEDCTRLTPGNSGL